MHIVWSAAILGMVYLSQCILDGRCPPLDWFEFFIAVALLALFLGPALSADSARRTTRAGRPPPRGHRKLRSDINQAGRDDWNDDDGGGE